MPTLTSVDGAPHRGSTQHGKPAGESPWKAASHVVKNVGPEPPNGLDLATFFPSDLGQESHLSQPQFLHL